nr:DUF1818 family protein [Gloeothece citriformis]
MDRLLKQGQGWRLGWDSQAEIYKGLVGSQDWAIELTEAELNEFCRLLHQLAQTMEQMKDHLMDSERIACEAESDLLWMEVEGFPHAYSLRLILHQDRRFEGNWSADAVKELIEATQLLKVF